MIGWVIVVIECLFVFGLHRILRIPAEWSRMEEKRRGVTNLVLMHKGGQDWQFDALGKKKNRRRQAKKLLLSH